MRIISDAMLARGVQMPIDAVRRRAARKAAARALHEVALIGGGDDPLVLALLGMHAAALASPASDAGGRRGHMLARSANGVVPSLEELAGSSAGWRRRIAAALAPIDPLVAAELLPVEDGLARAACLLAAGDPEARTTLGDAPGREADALRTAIAIERGDFAAARGWLGRMFGGDALSAPLPQGADAFTIHELAGDAAAASGPLVSMIMPVKDAADTLAMAAGSVARQGWRDLEILLVDDGSRDESPKIAARLAAADARFRVLANTGPPGVAGARNTGIAAAAGRWIGFLDADDWAHPERIARQIAQIGGGAATVSRHIRMDARGRPVAPRVFPMVRLCPISMLAQADALRRAGPFEIARTGSDAEMLARLDVLYGRGAVARDPAVLTVASWRPGSLSSDATRGMFAADRFAYREDWMRRHVGLARLPIARPGP